MVRKSAFITLAFMSAMALSGCGVGEAKITDTTDAQSVVALPVEISLPTRADIFAMYETTSTLESDADAPVAHRPGQAQEMTRQPAPLLG